MMNTINRIVLLSIFVGVLVSCVSTRHIFQPTPKIEKESYNAIQSTKGTVLISMNWGRKWNCGKYENAELRNIGFDLLPTKSQSDEKSPDLVINGPPSITKIPAFTNYAFQIEPGEYALSYINIKVARSVSHVGYFTATRSRLIDNGQAKGGSFKIETGETIYIGNFWLDCAYSPVIWRYYTEGKENFNKHMKEFAAEYPFINISNVKYRLFETKEFGVSYTLPR